MFCDYYKGTDFWGLPQIFLSFFRAKNYAFESNAKVELYINSASAQIARLYTIEDENKMCRALRNYNYRKRDRLNIDMHLSPEPLSYKPGSFLNKWIEKFEIGKSIEIKGTDEGLGLMIYLNTEKGKRLLADEGYGITQLVSLLLQIDNSIPLDAQHIPTVTLEKDGLDCNSTLAFDSKA